jgi:hypothetical protein
MIVPVRMSGLEEAEKRLLRKACWRLPPKTFWGVSNRTMKGAAAIVPDGVGFAEG